MAGEIYPRDRLMEIVKADVMDRAAVDLASLLRNAAEEAEGVVRGMVKAIGDQFGDIQTREAARFQRAHEDVGAAAVRSMAQGFRSRRFNRHTGRYRENQDRLSGTLGRALSNVDAHVRATPYDLGIINQDFLDREAAHWRRLNFGAGSGGAEGIQAPQQFQVTWGGLVAGSFGLEADPSPAFRIPRGYWIGPGGERVGANAGRAGQDRFYLPGMVSGMGVRGRPSPTRMTRGIASRNFLDAGVRRLANELPRAYEQIYNDLFTQARGTLQEVASRYGAKVIRPTPQTISYNYRLSASRARRG